MSDAKATAVEMAKLTMLSNKLNDIQLKNLKTYPFIFFDGINLATMDYDLTNQLDVSTEESSKEVDIAYEIYNKSVGHLRVTYDLQIEPVLLNSMSHMQTRFDHLEASVRNLLWKEIKVQIIINGKLVFESKKDEPK